MTKQDKELLLKDLCARLPYGVKCDWNGKDVLPTVEIMKVIKPLYNFKAKTPEAW